MRKIFSILFALVLAVSLMLVPAVVSANPGNGDVTIIVQNQAGVPIEGAQVNLYWSGGDKEAWMPAKITDANGTATFTAAEIAAFHGTSPRFQVYAGDNNGDYGNVYTVSVANEWACITYNTATDYIFTYNLIMFTKAAPAVVWGTETVTVTYTLAAAPPAGPIAKMGFFHGPLAAPTTAIWQACPKASGVGWDVYDMIATNDDGSIDVNDYVSATVVGSSLSATLPLRFLAGITDNIIAVPFLIKNPVTHTGLTDPEKSAAEDQYGVGSSVTVGLMTLKSEAVGMTANMPAPILSISVSPLSVNFGSVYAGSSSAAQTITVTNTAPILSEKITATVTNESRPLFYETNLKLDTVGVATWAIASLAPGTPKDVSAVLTVPPATTLGTLTATLVFWAEVAP